MPTNINSFTSTPEVMVWDNNPSISAAMRYLDVSGLRVKYKGPGSDDRDAAAIRTTSSVPSNCPIFYWEVEIINKGRDGFIGIGFSVQEVKLDRLPGWEPHSYGYHGDDGHVFNGRGTGRPYGPVFGTGDWIGIIFNRIERTISFTKKGYDLDVAFHNVPEDHLFPTVGFRTPDEEIIANFGHDLVNKPFRGDVDSITRAAVSRLYSAILSTPLPKHHASHDVVGELVLQYLTHNGYWESASAVRRDVLGGTAEVPSEVKAEADAMQALTETILRGNIDDAMKTAEGLAPMIMERHPHISFALLCQKFCQLIREGKDEEAMKFGSEVLAPSCKDFRDRALLDEALALFAYADPLTSPSSHLLSKEYKVELAAWVQRAVRTELGRRELSSLEDIYRQAHAVHDELVADAVPAAVLIDVDEFIDHHQQQVPPLKGETKEGSV